MTKPKIQTHLCQITTIYTTVNSPYNHHVVDLKFFPSFGFQLIMHFILMFIFTVAAMVVVSGSTKNDILYT